MSKGSNRRPQFVSARQLSDNWERIFGAVSEGLSGSEDTPLGESLETCCKERNVLETGHSLSFPVINQWLEYNIRTKVHVLGQL